MIGQMAIAIALPGFNDLGRSVTLFLFWGSFSLPSFYIYRNNAENLSIRSLNFFAKSIIELRSFKLFVYKYDFKCLLKG